MRGTFAPQSRTFCRVGRIPGTVPSSGQQDADTRGSSGRWTAPVITGRADCAKRPVL